MFVVVVVVVVVVAVVSIVSLFVGFFAGNLFGSVSAFSGLLRVGAFSRSHALLLGGRGSGRHTLVAMASHLLDGIKLEADTQDV